MLAEKVLAHVPVDLLDRMRPGDLRLVRSLELSRVVEARRLASRENTPLHLRHLVLREKERREFDLEIITPEGSTFQGQTVSLQLPGSDGSFGVLARHASLLGALAVGPLRMTSRAGDQRILAIGEGFVEVLGGRVRVLTDFAEEAGGIDAPRAEE